MSAARLNGARGHAIVQSALNAGVKEAVISPGSRNTPFVMALTDHAASGSLKLHTIIDERVAGFYALGLARISGTPVILSCTSGSAATHYYPAIVEASKSRLPLIVVSADRPGELQGCGAPQTMEQQGLFGVHARAFLHLSAPDESNKNLDIKATVDPLMARSLMPEPGPVHLNTAFRKPLWDPSDEGIFERDSTPLSPAQDPLRQDPEGMATLIAAARRAGRGLFIWGAGEIGAAGQPYVEQGQALSHQLAKVASLLGWPILSDATAGIRHTSQECRTHIGTADMVLQSEEFASKNQPELVIRIGGEPTSKAFTTWVRDYTAGKAILLDPSGWRRDPNRTAEHIVHGNPVDILQSLHEKLSSDAGQIDSGWLDEWLQADGLAKEAIASTCSSNQLWAGSAAATLSQSLPGGSLLHLASSLSIRAFASFVPQGSANVTTTSNRGVNGIDGTIATALGQAQRWNQGPVAVLLGDVAFVHDANALTYAPTDRPFIVVVLDNSGGGIFDHLPISSAGRVFERHFITDPSVNITAIGSAYGCSTHVAEDTSQLEEHITQASHSAGSHLIVARFDREFDLKRHRETWSKAAELIDGRLS